MKGRAKKKKKESGRKLVWTYLKYLLSFNIDGLFSDGTSRRSKRVSGNTLCCRNISWDSASLSSATLQSVCCVYLVHHRISFSILQTLLCRFSVLLLLVKVTSRWTSAPLSDPSWSHCSWCCNKLYSVYAYLCMAGVCMCAFWLAWQPGLDVKHLLGDSFGCGCGVTPRHICRGAGDPCNLPLVRPLLHHPNHFSDDCVIFTSSPLLFVHKSDILLFSPVVHAGEQQMHSLGEIWKWQTQWNSRTCGEKSDPR